MATSHFEFDDDDDDDFDVDMDAPGKLAPGRAPGLSGLSSIQEGGKRRRRSATKAMLDSVSIASTTKSKSLKPSRMKALIRSVLWGGARRKKREQGLGQVDMEVARISMRLFACPSRLFVCVLGREGGMGRASGEKQQQTQPALPPCPAAGGECSSRSQNQGNGDHPGSECSGHAAENRVRTR